MSKQEPSGDLYADLGVARDASNDEVKKAYRKLARKHHPDVNPNDPGAAERFKKVSFANSVLADATKRKRYDEFGADGLADGFSPEQARDYNRWQHGAQQSPHSDYYSSDVDLEDLLGGQFGFGGGRGGGRGGARGRQPQFRGRDEEGPLQVDFLDAVLGAKVPVNFEGRAPLEVRIPVGARDGMRIRLAEQGQPGMNGGPRGDLFLKLRVRSHPYFKRDGNDLLIDLPVTLPELVLGAVVSVPTPKGEVSLTIPKGSKSGGKLRLRGKGVAASRPGAPAGNLMVTLQLVLPEAESEQVEDLAKQFEPLYADFDVRAHLSQTKGKA